MPRTSLLLLCAAPVLAVAVEVVSYDATDDLPLVVADGVTGAVLLVSAAVLRERRRESLVGTLLTVAGVAWLAGTLWSPVRFLHRGALAHVHLSYPAGRIRSPLVGATVAAVYVVAFVEPLATNDGITLAVAVAIAFVAVAVFGRSSGTGRRAGIPALVAALALSGALALGAANRIADWRAANQVLWAYNLVIVSAVILLVVDLLRGRWAAAVVAGLVVDLGRQTGTATLRDELARALGDPHLVVGYWMPSEQGYVDEAGGPIEVAALQPGRVVTAIDDAGAPLVILVHDVAVLDDNELVASVSAAARLAVVNARLQAASRDRVEELVASRRRIVEAADDQRRRLGVELRNEVFSRLDRVDAIVGRVGTGVDAEPAQLVGELVAELREARADLDALSRGIHPLVLTSGGLSAALPRLAARAAIPVDVAVPATRFRPAIEAALYFVCAEALTNIAKHAQASRASIEIAAAGGVITAVVADDGRGGADTGRGSGLRGLADRVEAFGGRLVLDSNEGAGTTVVATIPDA